MKDIKVIFKGNKAPSGKVTEKEYYNGKKYLENLESSGKFDIEILEQPKKESKEKPKPKKKKASPKKGDK